MDMKKVTLYVIVTALIGIILISEILWLDAQGKKTMIIVFSTYGLMGIAGTVTLFYKSKELKNEHKYLNKKP